MIDRPTPRIATRLLRYLLVLHQQQKNIAPTLSVSDFQLNFLHRFTMPTINCCLLQFVSTVLHRITIKIAGERLVLRLTIYVPLICV